MEDDIGVGSVVGANFFNVLFVPGLFALLAPQVAQDFSITGGL